MAWFSYTGSDPSQPGSYTLSSSGTPPCSSPSEQMCALQAANNGSNEPVITDALKNEIINSLQNQVDGPNVHLKSR